jgi:PAS domain S-box-containing protein
MSIDPTPAVEHRLRAAVESAPSGLLMTDGDGRIVLVNREIERLFGYSREEMLGRPVEFLVPERFRQQHPHFRQGFHASPSARSMGAGRDLFGLRKDGAEVPIEIGLTPVATADGFFVIASIVDITARKRAEDQRLRLEQQLRHAQKMEAVGTLAGGIAHDFHNILGAIIGFAELLKEEVTGEQSQSDLRQIILSADRGKELVERILAFSRRQEPLRRPVSLAPTVTEVSKLLRASLPPSIQIRLVVDAEAPRVMADPASVHQVLMNLGTNAAHAMPSGGMFTISLETFVVPDTMPRLRPELREGRYALVTTHDTGVGMDAAVRERAFEPFFTTKPPGSGTGLGLAVVHGIMKEHGGVIEIESEPERGTTIRCFFPAIVAEPSEAPDAQEDVPRGSGQHILFVEDEALLAQASRRRLTALGYRVSVETDAVAALELFKAAPGDIDLVVTDYWMPHLLGLDLGREVRRIRADVPVIMLTGYMEELVPDVVTAAGITRLLKKPLTGRELGLAVHAVLAEVRRRE